MASGYSPAVTSRFGSALEPCVSEYIPADDVGEGAPQPHASPGYDVGDSEGKDIYTPESVASYDVGEGEDMYTSQPVARDDVGEREKCPTPVARDFDFVERPSQDFFCPVSLELLLEPQLTFCCGHHLSLETANRLRRENKPCPICNRERWDSVLDKYHRRRVHEVRVHCWYRDNGCEWEGELSELKKHSDSCERRLWECEHCGLKCLFEEGGKRHWCTCPKFPEPCPNNGCELGSVERCNMEQHRSVCSLEPVACEMKEFGCSVVVPRKEIATHMRESELQHLTAMTKLNFRLTRQLQQDSEERDMKIAHLQEQLTKTTEAVYKIQSELEHMQLGEQDAEGYSAIISMQADLAKLMGNVQELRQSSKHVEQHTVESARCSGIKEFVFKGYTKCKQRATRRNIDSNGPLYIFCSHHEGYCLQLTVTYYTDEHSDIGVFLGLMRGDYDDNLHWPVKMSVQLELVNQAGDHHHVVRNKIMQWDHRNTKRGCDQKAIDDSLIQYHLVERKDSDVQYIMNDSIKFRIHITVLE